jgi:UDP-2,3-diacylglucosamine pyrophosphatase LpxH
MAHPSPFADRPRGWLVLSDVHLGSDIAEGTLVRRPARSQSVDVDLVALLDHYRDRGGEDGYWHLVINGDFVDFIAISIQVACASLSTEPNDEELAHGLGSAEDHACAKLVRVAARHHAVFAALARFVGAGHHVTIVAGNHDKEFHWRQVQDHLKASLLGSAGGLDPRSAEAVAFAARIHFAPWFVWIEGVAYIEHGHQYDAYCATEHTILPQSPADPRRLAPGFSDVLLRFVVHHTRGLGQHGHDHMGVFDYMRLAVRLGIGGGIDLGRRFALAIIELFRLRRLWLSEAAQALQVEHERRIAHLAEVMRVGQERLRALTLLQAPPVMRSIRGILASLLLDRIALALFCISTLAVLAVLGMKGGAAAWAITVVLPCWWLGHRYLSTARNVDPQDALAARASPLVKLFPAAFVVMGHTHVPVRVPIDGGRATYINAGSWAEEEGAPADCPIAYRAARTHLVIQFADDGPRAELLTWASGVGPERFTTPS